METPIIVAIIAAAASAIASAITFFLTRKKEREAEWRKLRVEQYRELITAMSEVAGEATPRNNQRLALAANQVGLLASSEVLRYQTMLLDAVATGRLEDHDNILTSLMHAIRMDLQVPDAEQQSGISFKIWAAGKGKEKTK